MKRNQKSIIAQYNPKKLETKPKYLNEDVAKMKGWNFEGNKAAVFLSIRFIQHDQECISEWDKNEIKEFWSFVNDIHNYTWEDVYRTARKEKKNGLAYTVMPLATYPESDFKKQIDPECTFFELRISEKARVHCFRSDFICYVCWLDRGHKYA